MKEPTSDNTYRWIGGRKWDRLSSAERHIISCDFDMDAVDDTKYQVLACLTKKEWAKICVSRIPR